MSKSLVVLLVTLLIPFAAHAERVYETAVLKDEVGFVGDDGSKVTNAINMLGIKNKVTGEVDWQWRHVFIDLPVATNDVVKVEAFLANGDAIEYGDDPNFWQGHKFVKLWLVRDEGFEFFVRITFKE